MFTSPAPVTWLQGHLAAPSGRGVLGSPLYSPKRQGRPGLLTSIPRARRRVIGPSLGPNASLTKAFRDCCQIPRFQAPGEVPLAGMAHPPPALCRGSHAPAGSPRGAQARRVGEGFGAGGGWADEGVGCSRAEMCWSPRGPLRTEAGSACSLGAEGGNDAEEGRNACSLGPKDGG